MDVAKLGIEITQKGIAPANQQLGKLVEIGNKLDGVTPKIEAALKAVSNSSIGDNASSIKSAAEALSLYKDSTRGLKDFNINSGSLSALANAAEKLSANTSGLASAAEHLRSMADSMQQMKGAGLSSISTSSTTRSPPSGNRKTEVDSTNALEASQKRLVAQIEREAMAVGKTRSEYLTELAARRGVTDQTTQYIAKIKEMESGTQKYVMSARAQAAAMRMIPAQMTDIVTQLAGGQNPLLIMIQQGGQMKDMFQGFGGMFKGLAKYFTPAKLAIGAVASVVGVLGYSLYNGRQELKEYQNAILLTNNYVGLSADAFLNLQDKMGQMGSKGMAADALTAAAASGKILSETVVGVANAAMVMQQKFGISVEDTVKSFESLADKPSSAVLSLNSKYHFLTAAVWEQIKALEEEGKTREASILATQAFEEAIKTMSANSQQNLGYVETAWKGIKDTINEAKNAVMNFGRAQSNAQKIQSNQKRIETISDIIAEPTGYSDAKVAGYIKERDALEAENRTLGVFAIKQEEAAIAQREATKVRESALKASTVWESQMDHLANKSSQREKKLAALDKQRKDRLAGIAADMKLSPEQKASAVSGVEKDYGIIKADILKKTEDKDAKRAAQKIENKYNQMNVELEKTIASEKAKILTIQQGLNGEYTQNLAKVEAITENDRIAMGIGDAQLKILKAKAIEADNLIGRRKDEEAYQKLSIENTKKLAATEADIESVRRTGENARYTSAQEWLKTEQAGRWASKEKYMYVKTLAALTMQDNKKLQLDSELYQYTARQTVKTLEEQRGAIGLTTAEQEKRTLLLEKEKEDEKNILKYQNDKVQLQSVLNSNMDVYNAKLDVITAKEALASDPWESSLLAMRTYAENAGKFGESVGSAWTSAFSKMEDTFATFCTTGKMNFKSFAVSILSDMTKILAKAALADAMSMFNQGSGLTVSGGDSSPIISGVASAIGSWAQSAQGNIFSGGRRFAKGGAFTNSLVSSPTPFRFASGGSFSNGLMGEAGPEAVVPLTRMANGNLGVETAGGSGAVQNNVAVTVNVASDGSSSSSASSGDTNMQKMGTLIANKVKEVIVQEQRPGGLLTSR